MKDNNAIRLCYFTTMRTKELAKIPGNPVKEALEFGQLIDDVTLIHFHKKFTSQKMKENVRVITIPFTGNKGWISFALSTFISYFLAIPILVRTIKKNKINLIRSDDILLSGLSSIIASKITRIPCVVALLGDEEEVIRYKMGHKSRALPIVLAMYRKIAKFVISKSDAVIAINKILKSIAESYGCKKVYQAYPNLDLSRFHPQENAQTNENFTALYVGRLDPEKGPLNILKVAEIKKSINFVIAGDGSLRNEMERIVKEKKLTNVKLLGLIDHNELSHLYCSANVLLLPSYTEGLPVVMLEAMASELPVIVSNVGAVGEILEKNNGGFAVTPGNIDEIVSKLELLLENKDLCLNLGKKGRENVTAQFNNFFGTQLDIYKDVIKNKNRLVHG